MAIARHPTIANASNYAHLPAAYNTLSDLSRLPPLELEAAIVEGAVHPAMTRSEVKGLMFHRQTRTGPVQMLSNGQQTLYTTLVVDPPWQYTHDFIRGSAFDHYDPMSLDELAELELPAADAAHLYLWVTNSHLLEGHSLLDAWGFEYRTMLTWVKPQIGMGLYWRSVTEHVLFATRGRLETQRNDLRNCFEASRGRHSEKPDLFYELVEQASPGPYVDLFARRLRPGWAAWGNQIEQGA
jgi:N6-adenosine-specific RNA methylase IME4